MVFGTSLFADEKKKMRLQGKILYGVRKGSVEKTVFEGWGPSTCLILGSLLCFVLVWLYKRIVQWCPSSLHNVAESFSARNLVRA